MWRLMYRRMTSFDREPRTAAVPVRIIGTLALRPLSPPAPRPLDVFAVRIENNIVKVDIRRPIRRQSFVSSQVVRS